VTETIVAFASEKDPRARNKLAMKLMDAGAGRELRDPAFVWLSSTSTAGYRGTILYALLQTIGQWEVRQEDRDLLFSMAEDPGESWEARNTAAEILLYI
jgi:hypothetical protein